jgi:hypothetical protein
MKTPQKGKVFLLLMLLCLFGSCYKTSNVPVPQGPPVFDVKVGGVSLKNSKPSFTVNDSGLVTIYVEFSLTSGSPENYPITCYLSGLPKGTTSTPDSTTFKLNDRLDFTLSVQGDTGIYTFNINVVTSGGTSSYPVSLHVLPVVDYAPHYVGTYTGSDPCGYFSLGSIWYTYTATVATVPGSHNWLTIKNYRGLGDSIIVYAQLRDGLAVPIQTVKGYTIFSNTTGFGTIGTQENQKPTFLMRDTVVHNNDTLTCMLQLKMQ